MPSSWQAKRAATRPAYVPKLVIPVGTPCHHCGHVRSSHSALVVAHRCRVPECPCTLFEPLCGCGHLCWDHAWGTPPHPWACYQCNCLQFGAVQEVPASATLF